MAQETADVLVVGAGLAGLHTATLLAERGHDVLLVDRRTSLAGAIRTTASGCTMRSPPGARRSMSTPRCW